MGRPATPMTPPADAAAELADDLADGALSPDGAAAFTSLCRNEIDKAVGRGELVAYRYGRRVLIPKRAVVRWLAGRLADGGA